MERPDIRSSGNEDLMIQRGSDSGRRKTPSKKKKNWSSPSKPGPKIVQPTILLNPNVRDTKPQPPLLTILQKDIVEENTEKETQKPQETPSVEINTTVSVKSDLKRDITCVKLMNDHFQFLPETAMKILSDDTDFTVIGVLGFQSVGKSSILNAISKSLHESRRNPFKVPTEESCFHQTNGIDMTVCQEKFILLDLQPMLSGSILSKMIKQEPQMLASCQSYEHMVYLSSLELGILMLSICNLVVAVEENIENIAFWKYLKTIERLKWMIPDVSEVSTTPTMTLINQIKQIFNEKSIQDSIHQKEESLTPHQAEKKKRRLKKSHDAEIDEKYMFRPEDDVMKITSYQELLNLMFEGTRIKSDPDGVILPELLDRSSTSTINFLMVPIAAKSHACVSYKEEIRYVTQTILQMKKSRFKKPITQREWMRNTVKLWEVIKQSPFVAQYNETLKTTMYGTSLKAR